MNEILALSGTRQAQLICNGVISSTELIEAHIARIEEINPELNAVVEVLRAPALHAAKAVDRRKAAGEALKHFEGVPFSIKDSIEVEGTVCSAGTLGFRNRERSSEDATLVARLRAAGAIPLARTNLPDLLFAFESDNLIFGRTNNPFDVTRSSGGSSGGEAALIAACGSPFGLGSDAAGSVRLPAHYCGIASLKPTSGRLSRAGHVPGPGGWIEMLWQIGPMARHVEDLIAMMPVLLGADARDRTVVPMPWVSHHREPETDCELRVAFFTDIFTDNGCATPDAATQEAVRAAAATLGTGVCIEEARPPSIDCSYELEMKILGADGGDGVREYLKDIGSDRTHPLLDAWLAKLERHRTDVKGFAKYWAELDEFRDEMAGFLTKYDAILSPVASQPAVPHGTSINDEVFAGFSYTMTHNLTGWPAAVVRAGTSPEGLPIGVQIAAAPWREDLVLRLAHSVEKGFTQK